MALDDLQSDLKVNLDACASLAKDPEVTPRQIMQHVQGFLWPMIESMLEEMTAMADTFDDVIDEAGDMLQPETAGVFATVIVLGAELVATLKSRVAPGETDLMGKIAAFEAAAKVAGETLEEITVEDGMEGEQEDE